MYASRAGYATSPIKARKGLPQKEHLPVAGLSNTAPAVNRETIYFFSVDLGLNLSLSLAVLVLFFLHAKVFYVTEMKFATFLQTTAQIGCHSHLTSNIKVIGWFVISK